MIATWLKYPLREFIGKLGKFGYRVCYPVSTRAATNRGHVLRLYQYDCR
jgi:hypothetical protein